MLTVPVAFDVETDRGRPFALGIRGGGLDTICSLRKGEGLLRLLEALTLLSASKQVAVVAGAHNLRFDLGVLLYDHDPEVLKAGEDIEDIPIAGGKLSVHFGRPCFATFRIGRRVVSFVDTFAYFTMSLDRAAQALGLTIRKMAPPSDLGYRRFTIAEIGPYLRRDIAIAHALLAQILAWWKEYGIRPAISAPQMAQRVFQHSFLRNPWVTVDPDIEKLALLSYHGGKNGCYVDPGWFSRVYSYDLRSAYPWAMTQIPPMHEGLWEWTTTLPQRGEFGFSVIWGEAPDTPYPIFYSHDFTPLRAGESFGPLTVTTMEVAAAHEQLRWKPKRIISVIWRTRQTAMSDLGHYAVAMYDRRLAAKTAQEKLLFKLLGNSLYGKFIARHEEDGFYVAGSLFYPVVASWITALVRVKVWESELKYHVYHTATDGVMSPVPMQEGEGLGSWKYETKGPVLILRNKLYLLFNEQSRRLEKAAYHGFHGDTGDLWRILRTGNVHYKAERLSGWLESRRLRSRPYAPVVRDMRLDIPDTIRAIRRGKGGYNPFRCSITPHTGEE
jgi:hypothetical protein